MTWMVPLSFHNSYPSFPSLLQQSLFYTSVILLRAGLHFFMLFSMLQYYISLSSLILSFTFPFPNRSMTINATACIYHNRLLQSVMLEVVMYGTTLLTLLVSVCTILLSHAFSDGNASLVLFVSTSLILNSI